MSNRKDLANGVVQSVSGNTIVLKTGYGQIMPDVPFKLTCTPPGELSTMGNSEIVNVTGRLEDTLTIERAQNGTTQKDIGENWIVANAIYADEPLQIAPNATLPGGTMGLDAPFGIAALRFYNDNNGGNLQFVSPNGNSDWYAGGNNVLSVSSNRISTNGYPIYVNSAASIDGSTTGQVKVTGLFMPVQATTAGAPAYVKGALYFDTTLNKLRIGGATGWETVTNTGDNLIISTSAPTPEVGAQVLWLDTTGGNITLNLVTGE